MTFVKAKSKKRRKRESEARPVRDALIAEVGRCEVCGHDPRKTSRGGIRWKLHVHEIARGSSRQKALDQRYALLVVCWPCHDKIRSGIKAEAYQLSLLKQSRPEDYDLTAYNRLKGLGRNRITEDDVDGMQ